METTTEPDDHGITPTNDPALHVLWERHGATVSLALVRTDAPPPHVWALALPS